MPLESVLFLALVLAALSLFAAVLAYAEWTTRKVTRDSAVAEPAPVKLAQSPAEQSAAPAHFHDKAA